jgi:uncharacterized protein YxeA
MKLWEKILIIVLIVCVILAIFVARKVAIINNLANASKEYADKTNYLAIVQSLQNGNVNMLKSYNKDGSYLTTMQVYGKNIQAERSLTIYKKDGEEIGIIQSGEEKIALLDGNLVGGDVQVANTLSVVGDNVMQKILFAISSRITTDDYNSTECYLIELDDWKLWVDKETGLIIREINGGIVSERFYEFDNVGDEDIIKPDISDCKIQENN